MNTNLRSATTVCLVALVAIVVAIIANNPSHVEGLKNFDQGWATLIAGLLGFGAIAYQTKIGFRNLQKSSSEQAKADRVAREHQAQLSTMLDSSRERRKAQVLASTLAAEISAINGQLKRHIDFLASMAKTYESIGDVIPNLDTVAELLPTFRPLAYEANVGDLGLLGPSTAHDVVALFSRVSIRPSGSANLLTGKHIAGVLRSWISTYENWEREHIAVLDNLMAVVDQHAETGHEAMSTFSLN